MSIRDASDCTMIFASHDRSLMKYFDTEIELSEFNRAQKERQAVFEVALSSLWSRRGSVLLTVASLSISMVIVIGVEHIRAQAESSFVRTISNVDLLVGARTSQINLLLYSVFRIGNATNNIRWESYEDIATRSEVSWSIPLLLGDSHQGYRVLGTNSQYFEHFRYGDSQELQFSEGSHSLMCSCGAG